MSGNFPFNSNQYNYCPCRGLFFCNGALLQNKIQGLLFLSLGYFSLQRHVTTVCVHKSCDFSGEGVKRGQRYHRVAAVLYQL